MNNNDRIWYWKQLHGFQKDTKIKHIRTINNFLNSFNVIYNINTVLNPCKPIQRQDSAVGAGDFKCQMDLFLCIYREQLFSSGTVMKVIHKKQSFGKTSGE